MRTASSDTPVSSTTGTDSSQNSTKTLLLDEIKRINERLIHVSVKLDSDQDSARGREGITLTCFFNPVCLTRPLKLLIDAIIPFPPLRLLIPADYPESSPVILKGFKWEEAEEISEEVKVRFNRHIGALSQPICLAEMAGVGNFILQKSLMNMLRELVLEPSVQRSNNLGSTFFIELYAEE